MIYNMSVAQLAKALKNKEVSAVEVVQNFLEKEDLYGAFLCKNAEFAIKCAKEADELIAKGENIPALAGIPIAVKDNICTAGMPTTCASKTLEGFTPPYDATVIEKINKNYMPIIGKTNMDEFGMGSTGENSAYFATKNPRDLTCVAGGSSSGSAAAVAGKLAPIALGSDTGGSVRLPAAYCKIVGFKPSYGAISRFGLIAFASSLDQVGILAGSAEDCGMLFEAISGKDARDMTSIEVDVRKILSPKIGIIADYTYGFSGEITQLSCFDMLLPTYYIISSAEAASNLARFDGVRYGEDSLFGNEVRRRIELGNFVLSAENVGEYYNRAVRARSAICREVEELFKKFDFLVMPTACKDAPKIGETDKDCSMYELDAYTVLANLAYLPAISLPIGERGVTIMTRRGEDHALISFAKEVGLNGI